MVDLLNLFNVIRCNMKKKKKKTAKLKAIIKYLFENYHNQGLNGINKIGENQYRGYTIEQVAKDVKKNCL